MARVLTQGIDEYGSPALPQLYRPLRCTAQSNDEHGLRLSSNTFVTFWATTYSFHLTLPRGFEVA